MKFSEATKSSERINKLKQRLKIVFRTAVLRLSIQEVLSWSESRFTVRDHRLECTKAQIYADAESKGRPCSNYDHGACKDDIAVTEQTSKTTKIHTRSWNHGD